MTTYRTDGSIQHQLSRMGLSHHFSDYCIGGVDITWISDEKALAALARSSHPEVRADVAAHMYTSDKTRDKLWEDSHPMVMEALEAYERETNPDSDWSKARALEDAVSDLSYAMMGVSDDILRQALDLRLDSEDWDRLVSAMSDG